MTKEQAIEKIRQAVKAAEAAQRALADATFGLEGKHAKEGNRLCNLACDLYNDTNYLLECVKK